MRKIKEIKFATSNKTLIHEIIKILNLNTKVLNLIYMLKI